jgi:moderate conductance mechanosensitive channel
MQFDERAHAQVQQKEQLAGAIARDWRDDLERFTRKDAPKIAGILVVAFILTRLLRLVSKRLEAFSHRQHVPGGMRGQQLRTLSSVIFSVGIAIIYFMAFMQVLPVFGIDVKPLLASAGVAGLAIGFGAQTLVKDVINGFFILLENQYDIGDVVRLADRSGTVEVMSLRRTILRDANGTLHTIPNSEIKVVSNSTRDWAQISLHVSVDYNESSDRVMKLLEEAVTEVYNDERYKDVMVAQPEVPGIDRVAGQEVDYLVLAKVRPGQQFPVTRELRRRIKDCLQRNNVRAGSPAKVYIGDASPD